MTTKIMNLLRLSLSLTAMAVFTSCISLPTPEPRVSKPLMTDTNEIHWRMYYEDQFDAYHTAAPPAAGDPDVAWNAYYSEKNAYAIRRNNELLQEQLRLQKEHNKKAD